MKRSYWSCVIASLLCLFPFPRGFAGTFDVTQYLGEYEHTDDLPPAFRRMIESLNSDEDEIGQRAAGLPGRTRITLSLINDSLAIGIGAIGQLFGEDVDGNDTGRTHGLNVGVQYEGSGGITHSYSVASQLYTRQADGTDKHRVYFTEEDVLSYIADSRRKELLHFFELGGGIVYADRSRDSLGARRQQQWFHGISGSQNTQYAYLEGESKLGAFVHAAVGLQKKWIMNPMFSASFTEKIGAAPHTMKNGSRVFSELEAALLLTLKKRLLELSVKGEVSIHGEGVEVIPAITLRYEQSRWGVVSSVSFPYGDLHNPMYYNDDKDPFATLTFYVVLDPRKQLVKPRKNARK